LRQRDEAQKGQLFGAALFAYAHPDVAPVFVARPVTIHPLRIYGARTYARDCGDLVVCAAREWWGSELLKLLIYAGLAHAGIWLIGVAIAAWQWPRGSRLYPVVVSFAVLSAPGIAVTLWRQRLRIHRTAYCSLRVAELD